MRGQPEDAAVPAPTVEDILAMYEATLELVGRAIDDLHFGREGQDGDRVQEGLRVALGAVGGVASIARALERSGLLPRLLASGPKAPPAPPPAEPREVFYL